MRMMVNVAVKRSPNGSERGDKTFDKSTLKIVLNHLIDYRCHSFWNFHFFPCSYYSSSSRITIPTAAPHISHLSHMPVGNIKCHSNVLGCRNVNPPIQTFSLFVVELLIFAIMEYRMKINWIKLRRRRKICCFFPSFHSATSHSAPSAGIHKIYISHLFNHIHILLEITNSDSLSSAFFDEELKSSEWKKEHSKWKYEKLGKRTRHY